MHECLLCKRDMKVSNDVFGNGCIKNIYSFLDLKMPRKVNHREETLYKNIMKINNINSINKNQKIWLTDRYLTYQYLNRIPYGNYNTIKNQINNDIQNIKQIKKDELPKSAKRVSLKQAYDLYKKVMKFQDGIDKISKGNLTHEDSIKTIITSISFVFNMSKNKSQYEKNAFKGMQFAFWQTVIETQEITDDESFKRNVSNIINKYGKECNEFIFDSLKDKSFPMNFNDKDLYFAIHSADLHINGKKANDKWNLEIMLHDRYDYSKPKMPDQYYNDTSSVAKSMLSSTLYNLASFSTKCTVMKEYDIDIQFYIEGFEVI